MNKSSAAIVLVAGLMAAGVHAAEMDASVDLTVDPIGPYIVSQAVNEHAGAGPAASSVDEARKALFVHKRMPEKALSETRGGALTVVANDLTAKGTLTDNVASHLTTGTNIIDGNSFGNAAGLPMVIQNTGNNVLIQNSTILNLNLK